MTTYYVLITPHSDAHARELEFVCESRQDAARLIDIARIDPSVEITVFGEKGDNAAELDPDTLEVPIGT
jgi:hypothetical protein